MDAADLRAERARLGVKQYRLAAALGIPPTTLSQIENGRKQAPPERMQAILRAMQELAVSGDKVIRDATV